METRPARAFRRATAGATSRSGTAFAASPFATAATSSCNRNPARPLTRYFPEIVDALLRSRRAAVRHRRRAARRHRTTAPISTRCFSASIRPRVACAGSRRRRRHLTLFSICSSKDARVLRTRAARASRAARAFRAAKLREHPTVRLSPATRDVALAKRWLGGSLARLDGVIAKRDVPYAFGSRDAAVKDQAQLHSRLRRRGVSHGHRRRRRFAAARASTTTKGTCITWVSSAR